VMSSGVPRVVMVVKQVEREARAPQLDRDQHRRGSSGLALIRSVLAHAATACASISSSAADRWRNAESSPRMRSMTWFATSAKFSMDGLSPASDKTINATLFFSTPLGREEGEQLDCRGVGEQNVGPPVYDQRGVRLARVEHVAQRLAHAGHRRRVERPFRGTIAA